MEAVARDLCRYRFAQKTVWYGPMDHFASFQALIGVGWSSPRSARQRSRGLLVRARALFRRASATCCETHRLLSRSGTCGTQNVGDRIRKIAVT